MTPTRRPLTIFDIMALVAATAVGLVLARAVGSRFIDPTGTGEWLFAMVFGPATAIVVAISVALILLRLARPRPQWRRVARQPGFIACAASVVAIILGLPINRALSAISAGSPFDTTIFILLFY